MVTGRPLFPGSSVNDQLLKIFKYSFEVCILSVAELWGPQTRKSGHQLLNCLTTNLISQFIPARKSLRLFQYYTKMDMICSRYARLELVNFRRKCFSMTLHSEFQPLKHYNIHTLIQLFFLNRAPQQQTPLRFHLLERTPT